MLLKSVRNQLLHDLKASWQKSLVLGVLLLVGVYFWIPPVYQAVFGSSRSARAGELTTAPVSPEALAAARSAADQAAKTAAKRSVTWENAEELFTTDPLLRPAELASMPGSPFEISQDQFGPPVLFAEDEPQDAKKQSSTKGSPAGKTTANDKASTSTAKPAQGPQGTAGLVLKSTILGASRRAALINDKLYPEGATIEWNGESYLLEAVRARQVELKKGEESLLLDLPGLTSSDGIHIERVDTRELQTQ